MHVTEDELYEAFGVSREEPEPEGDESAQEQPPEGDGQTAQEPEGGAEENDREGEPEQPPEGDAGEPKPEPEQTAEQRKENAARRRREELEEAVRQAREEERGKAEQQMQAFFEAANLKDTFTGEPIKTMEQFQAWKDAFDAAQLQKDLKAGKLTPEGLQKVIGQTPAMQRVEQLLKSREEDQRRAEEEAARAKVDAEIEQIGRIDPGIKSVEDLLKMPKAKEFYEYVKKGNSFLDAYYLSHREELAEKQAQAARQQAQSLGRSKEHLKAAQARGAGAETVPAEELRMFREFNPGATEEEIQNYYNRYKKGSGG